ncbi:MAG: hypothetical protein IKN64_09620 [Desulfovibrio sp.]|nr:hypothetical protein [Desulfovibrio sp.]
MPVFLNAGDVVKTRLGDYGVVLKTQQKDSDVNVDIDLVGKDKLVTFLQSKLEVIPDLADVPEELQYALSLRSAKIKNAGKTKHDIFSASTGRKPSSVPNIGIDGCMAHFKEWQKKKQHGAVGFRDEKFIFAERTYRIKCVELFNADLNKTSFADLLAAEDYESIFSRATAIFSSRKAADGLAGELNYVNDRYGSITRFKDVLFEKGAEKAKNWAELLYDVLYGNDVEKAFDAFASFYNAIDLKDNKWPLSTVYLQIRDIKQYICIKPDFFETVASSMGYESITGHVLPKAAPPSWKNYQYYLQFAEWLMKQLQTWKEPERRLREDGDMLDIQAFCYIIYQQHKKKADLTT